MQSHKVKQELQGEVYNKFDECLEFGLADPEDVDEIMAFYKKYWSDTHILANDRDFFLYEFSTGKQINFYLAKDKKTKEIVAAWGLYYYSSPYESGKTDMAGGMYKANPDFKMPMVGLELAKRMFRELNPRAYLGNGANPKTMLVLATRMLRQKGDKLQHYYRLADLEDYKVAKVTEKKIPPIRSNQDLPINLFHSAEEMYSNFREELFVDRIPYKDRGYVEKRYFNHPIYQYEMYGVSDRMVLVTREIVYNGGKVLRIIDILGDYDLFGSIGNAIQKLMDEKGYEYIDIYEYGMKADSLVDAGFILLDENEETVIPNYFEPYVPQNVDIYFHTPNDQFVMFKGDGDQDRPNFRPVQ